MTDEISWKQKFSGWTTTKVLTCKKGLGVTFPHQTEIFSTDEKPSPTAQIQLKLICVNPSSTRGDCQGIIFSIMGTI